MKSLLAIIIIVLIGCSCSPISDGEVVFYEDMMKAAIVTECRKIEAMLLEKNAAYGNSAADPVRIFSRVDPEEQINVRIDDKLSRIQRGHEYGTEDTEWDLLGYLVLKRAVRRLHRDMQPKDAQAPVCPHRALQE